MWPLSIVFLLALNAPQQNAPAVGQDFRARKLPEIKISQFTLNSSGQDGSPSENELRARKLLEVAIDRMKLSRPSTWPDTCFAIRSYVFRGDGQAPTLVNTTTCTPGNTLRTLQVSPAPVRLVPAK